MKERSILFGAPMVLAILEDRKTQTRRVVKPQPVQPAASCHPSHTARHPAPYFDAYCSERKTEANPRGMSDQWSWWQVDDRQCLGQVIRCPYGKPGDRLRVKEAAWMWSERVPNGTTKTGKPKWLYVPMRQASILYCADHPNKPEVGIVSPDTGNQWGWRKKIGRFLPAWASRITLEITGVRVERLQDICGNDCIAEGAWNIEDRELGRANEAIAAYRALWESINGTGSWEANPFVWVIEFKRLQP